MKYHIFTNIFNKSYVSVVDVCIYCDKSSNILYDSLSEELKERYYTDNIHYKTSREVFENYLAKHIYCENGISEEEYIIKKLME